MDKEIIDKLTRSGDLTPIWTATEAVANDMFTQGVGIEARLLMENAGKAVAELAIDIIKKEQLDHDVIIFVGPGNNGADALVAARHLLAHRYSFAAFVITNGKQGNNEQGFQLDLLRRLITLPRMKASIIDWNKEIVPFDSKPRLIIDGIFGAGLNRPLGNSALDVVRLINLRRNEGSKVLSIDVPSGLTLEAIRPKGECIHADYTISFDGLKRVHIGEPTKNFCGQSMSATIGLLAPKQPTNFWLQRRKVLSSLYVPTNNESHKGDFGHVLVFEGHERYIGASRLVAHAALRAGAGLVTIATHQARPLIADKMEVMHCPLKDVDNDLLKKIDAMVLGPGLSTDLQYQEAALEFLNGLGAHIPMLVIDADGLRLLTHHKLRLSHKLIVATPHPKEAARLLNCEVQGIESNRFVALEALTKLDVNFCNDVTWILKGATSLVKRANGPIYAFRGDLPVLSSPGMGDVLSGAIAGLCKQTPSALAATLLAVSLEIAAGRSLSKRLFRGRLASELADLFPLLSCRNN